MSCRPILSRRYGSLFFGILWSAVALPLNAQPRLRVERFSLNRGFTQTDVSSILRDSRGFLWFGNDEGLVRFDGYRFREFSNDPANPSSISHNGVTNIYEDKAGNLWVATKGGLNRFDYGTETFNRFEHNPADTTSLSGDLVTCLFEDRQKNLWIGTRDGLNRMNRISGKFERFVHNPLDSASLSNNPVSAIQEDRQGNLWIGVVRGVNRMNLQTRKFEHYWHNPADKNTISSDVITTIREDGQGNLWFGTFKGLNRLDQKTGKFERFQHDVEDKNSISSDYVWAILEDRQGDLWIGTTGGLNRMDRKTGKFERFQHNAKSPGSLAHNHVSSLCEDRQGNLWIGTLAGGIHRLETNTLQPDQIWTLPANPAALLEIITFILEDRQHNLWIGSGGGLYRLNQNTGAVTHFRHDPKNAHSLAHDEVNAAIEDRNGDFWIATGEGIDRLDRKTGRFIHYQQDTKDSTTIGGHHIHHLFEDRQHNFWVATRNGLDRFDRKTGRFEHFRHRPEDSTSLSHNNVNSIYEDRQGNLWVSTNSGPNRLDRITMQFEHFRHHPQDPHTLSNDDVDYIFEDRRGNLWIGTTFGGINRLDRTTKRFERFSKKNGLVSNFIGVIAEDPAGLLWWGNFYTLTRFDPQTGQSRHFGGWYGVETGPTNAVYYSAFSGRLYAGIGTQLIAFQPDKIRVNTEPPPVVLTRFTRYNSKESGGAPTTEPGIGEKKSITVSYEDNILEFECAALNFIQPEKNQYAYRLLGFADQWIALGTDRKITFTNLPAGQFTLQVIGSNNDGIWNNEGVRLAITVLPPWWKTWWAYTAYALFALSLLFWLRRTELKKQERKLALEREKLEQEQKVNERLQRINEAAAKFVPNEFLRALGREHITEVVLGDHAEREVTVLFADIRDYTSLSETMTPEQNFNFVKAFNGRMGPLIQQHGGFINQYLGDGIMAIFPDNPADALAAAVAMQQSLAGYNRQRAAKGRLPIQLGIGMHSGNLIMGIIGDERRLDAATISDTVNTASRLESLSKYYGARIVLGKSCIEGLSDPAAFNLRFLGKVQVKGKTKPLEVFECFDGDEPDVCEKKRDTLLTFGQGMHDYQEKRFAAAAAAFEAVLKQHPGDATAQLFLNKAAYFIAHGVPEGWMGVEMMGAK